MRRGQRETLSQQMPHRPAERKAPVATLGTPDREVLTRTRSSQSEKC